MRPIELSSNDVINFKVDGVTLKTTFDVAAAKKAVKLSGPVILDGALKYLKNKLEDDPAIILKSDEILKIISQCRERVLS